MIKCSVFSIAISFFAAPSAACDIALVLAVDVSGSVDASEYAIQMQGLATALNDPAVAEALVTAEAHVMLMQWTGSGKQVVSLPWTALGDYSAVEAFANAVVQTPRRWRDYATAIGESLAVGLVAFEAPEVAACTRRVIGVSGDGVSNEGTPPEEMRLSAADRGVTINAIAIEESEEGLTDYYRMHVITGPGAFAVRAATFEAYPDRMRQKLLREVVMQLAEYDRRCMICDHRF